MRKKKVPATKKMCPRFEQLEPRAMLAGLADLRVSELMYNPIATDGVENHDLEYIELLNTGVASLNVSNVHLKDAVFYRIPAGTTLTPGGRIVIVRFDPNSSEPAEMAKLQAFRDIYNIGAGVRLFGPYAGKLDNSGELFTLTDSANITLYSFLFLYGTTDNWPDRANGNGSSLEVIYPKGDPWDPNNWRASTEYGGTPGTAGMGPKTDVVINEVLAHTNLPQLDAIELYNTTGAEITIGGWYLSDSNVNYKKFQIPAGTTLPAHGYIVYDEDDFNPTSIPVSRSTRQPARICTCWRPTALTLRRSTAGELTIRPASGWTATAMASAETTTPSSSSASWATRMAMHRSISSTSQS
ncbi:MAG: lamin tail domain-containing protein [Pirellulales bacterium]